MESIVVDRKVTKAETLLKEHKADIIEQMGPAAFDALTPYETATELDIDHKRIPDLIRQGWLAPIAGKDIGRAHQYYRWRVAFVKQYRNPRVKESEKQNSDTIS